MLSMIFAFIIAILAVMVLFRIIFWARVAVMIVDTTVKTDTKNK